jgi:hypothetical protein
MYTLVASTTEVVDMQGSASIAVHAPREVVYAHVAELTRHPAWRPRLRVEPDGLGPTQVGASYMTWGRHPERHRVNHETVTELVEPWLVAFDGVDERLGVFHHRFELHEAGASTVIVRTAGADLRPRPLRLLLPLVVRTLVPVMLHRDLRALKRYLEASPDMLADPATSGP